MNYKANVPASILDINANLNAIVKEMNLAISWTELVIQDAQMITGDLAVNYVSCSLSFSKSFLYSLSYSHIYVST